tara:strand:+ start:633 stop:1163 length:531 start_codon:yes stop_codon:yes gene_type:complete
MVLIDSNALTQQDVYFLLSKDANWSIMKVLYEEDISKCNTTGLKKHLNGGIASSSLPRHLEELHKIGIVKTIRKVPRKDGPGPGINEYIINKIKLRNAIKISSGYYDEIPINPFELTIVSFVFVSLLISISLGYISTITILMAWGGYLLYRFLPKIIKIIVKKTRLFSAKSQKTQI